MQLKMCVLGGVLICLLLVCICVLSLSVYSEESMGGVDANLNLSWGDFTAVESENLYTLPIYIQNIPPEGFCGLLFWVDIQGDATIHEVTWGNLGENLCPTSHIQNTTNRHIVGILLESTTNTTPLCDGLLCTLTLSLDPIKTYRISLVCGGMAMLNQENQVTPLPVSVPNPQEITLTPQETTVEVEVEADTHTPPCVDTEQETTQDSHATNQPLSLSVNGVFVGVQDAIQTTITGDTSTYALRFLFMIDTTNPPPQTYGSVICMGEGQGGGVLNLSCDTKDFVLSMQNGQQITLTPNRPNVVWLTYTYTGLDPQKNFTFEVYHSQGKTYVIYQNGIIRYI